MAGNFALDTTAHPTVNSITFHGRTGTQFKLTGTPTSITDPADRATARLLMSRTGTKYVAES